MPADNTYVVNIHKSDKDFVTVYVKAKDLKDATRMINHFVAFSTNNDEVRYTTNQPEWIHESLMNTFKHPLLNDILHEDVTAEHLFMMEGK